VFMLSMWMYGCADGLFVVLKVLLIKNEGNRRHMQDYEAFENDMY
jgi:hypothetical protein